MNDIGKIIFAEMKKIADGDLCPVGDIDPHPIEITGDVDNALLEY